jgi:TolA-binding protein
LAQDTPELKILSEDKKLMDPFEEHSLTKADKTFDKKEYPAAAAEYDAFILEFPQSRVLPYVIFRKARSIHLDNKRFNAIKVYNQVLDYYPKATHYAAAALYYIGQCYFETGDPEKAVKAWKQMIENKDYCRHYLAADALNMLALNYIKQKKPDQAIGYYEQVVIDFRTANPNAAWDAIWQVVPYYLKTSLNEAKLREFYIKAGGVARDPVKIKGDINTDKTYWDFVRLKVKEYGQQFPSDQNDLKIRLYRYWTRVMNNKFPEWDDFQIDIIDFQFAYEGDEKQRSKRLDAQFVKFYNPGDYARIVKWIGVYSGRPAKMKEYYAKLDLPKMNNALIEQLAFIFAAQKEYEMAKNLFAKIKLGEMNDQAKQRIARRLWESVRAGFPIQVLKNLTDNFTDPDFGKMEMLQYYYWAHDANEGIPQAEKLLNSPQFASDAAFIMGEMLYWKKQYAQAITRYQQADNPPANVFRIADCYMKMGKLDSAMASLTEIENFFPKDAPRAALVKANLFRDADQADKRVAALRNVLKKYPKSPESSTAHQELEQLGVKIGGGQDTD